MGEQTGIEVKLKFPESAQIIGKVMHFLHLDQAMQQAVVKWNKLVIEVDGAHVEQQYGEPHVVECAPGPHAVKVWSYELGPGGQTMGKLINKTELKDVVVKPGQLTQLVYQVLGPATNPSLTLAG